MATLTPIEGRKKESRIHKLISEFGTRIITIAAALGFSNVISILYAVWVNLSQDKWFQARRLSFILAAQAFIVLIALCIPLKDPTWIDEEDSDEWTNDKTEALREVMKASGYENNPSGWEKAKKEADSASDKYQSVWKGLWFSWFILYLILACKNYPGVYLDFQLGQPDFDQFQRMYFFDIASDLFHNVAIIMILFCYFVLSEPSNADNKKKYRERRSNYYGWIAIVVVFTVLEVIVVGSEAHILDENYYTTNFTTIKGSYLKVTETFKLISGISAATAMALYFSRLNSRFLKTQVVLLALFYLYAAIQPSYPKLSTQDSMTIAIFIAVLVLKCLWFVYVALLIESGRLQFYFVRVRSLNRDVAKEFRNFKKLLDQAS